MKQVIVPFTPEEITIIADSLAETMDDLEVSGGSPLLFEKTKALLDKIERVEQTEVFPH